MTAAPAAASSSQMAQISALAPHIEPARRLVQDPDRGGGLQPAPDHHLLLVAARERADRLAQAGVRPAAAAPRACRALSSARRRSTSPQPRQAAQVGERQVIPDRHRQQQALAAPVLGHEADAPPRLARAHRRARPPSSRSSIRPPSTGSSPTSARAISVRPDPSRPHRPRISPAAQGEGDILDLAIAREAGHLAAARVARRLRRARPAALPLRPIISSTSRSPA